MKKLNYIVLSILVSTFAFTSCDALLDTESERYTFEDEFQMKSAHDTIYSMVGVFTQLQKLGDRYILLGELRSELMETTDNASRYLKEINDFNFSEGNPYIDQKDYYAVINSCNYITKYVDQSYTILSDRAMMRSYAAAKAIRAWTYLQLALNFDTVYYYSNPITTVADATKSYPAIGMSALADSLIADLLPIKDINAMELGTFGAFKSTQTIFPIKFILGDLYLWKGDNENAARSYYDLIFTNKAEISKDYASFWTIGSKNEFQSITLAWHELLMPSSTENITTIASSATYGQQFTVDSLSYHYDIAPSAIAIGKWETPIYYYSPITQSEGDLRVWGSLNYPNLTTSLWDASPNRYIIKYNLMNTETEKCLVIYRNSLLYLRYAEAVNRLGCPQLAFAVIKKGLSEVSTRAAVIRDEVTKYGNGAIPTFMTFSDAAFVNNAGIRQRGLGNTNLDTTVYVIPRSATKADTLDFVEDAIVEELALETAFEGNRFHDLMRIAKRRGKPEYLADKVSAKYTTNKAEIRRILMEPLNWYLPH